MLIELSAFNGARQLSPETTFSWLSFVSVGGLSLLWYYCYARHNEFFFVISDAGVGEKSCSSLFRGSSCDSYCACLLGLTSACVGLGGELVKGCYTNIVRRLVERM